MTEQEYRARKARADRMLVAMADLKPQEQEVFTMAVEGAAMMNRLVEQYGQNQKLKEATA